MLETCIYSRCVYSIPCNFREVNFKVFVVCLARTLNQQYDFVSLEFFLIFIHVVLDVHADTVLNYYLSTCDRSLRFNSKKMMCTKP